MGYAGFDFTYDLGYNVEINRDVEIGNEPAPRLVHLYGCLQYDGSSADYLYFDGLESQKSDKKNEQPLIGLLIFCYWDKKLFYSFICFRDFGSQRSCRYYKIIFGKQINSNYFLGTSSDLNG